MDLYQEKPQIQLKSNNSNMWVFVCSVVAGLLTYFMLFSDYLTNPDGMFVGGGMDLAFSGGWEVSLGRWMLPILDRLRGGVTAPLFNTLLSLIFLSLAGVLIISLFRLNENRWLKLTAVLMIICSPAVMVLLTYFYCSANYALAFLLSVSAVWVIYRYPNAKGVFLGAITVALSLSIYQSYIGTTASLGLECLLLQMLNSDFNKIQKEIQRKLVCLVATGVAGIVLYYFVALPIVLNVLNIELAGYKGANELGVTAILLSLPKSIPAAYANFLQFFLTEKIARNPFGICVFSGCLLVLAIAGIFKNIFLRKGSSIIGKVLTILMVAVLPIACNVINLLNPATEINLLTSGGMLTIMPFCLTVICYTVMQMRQTIGKDILKIGAIAVAALLIWGYVLAVTTNMMYLKRQKNQTQSFVTRLCYKLEEEYQYSNNNASKIYIAGVLSQGNYNFAQQMKTLDDHVDGYTRWGDIWGVFDNSLVGWCQVFAQYTGVFLNMCTVQEAAEIVETQEFKEMPNYPEDGSIQVINDIIVVKVSDTTVWKENGSDITAWNS